MAEIILFFNEKNFEYDVYNLIKAFYPEKDIKMFYETEQAEAFPGEWEMYFRVFYSEKRIDFSASVQENQIPAGKEKQMPAAGQEQILSLFDHSCLLRDPTDRIETKNQLKKLVYSSLTEMTQRKLPWGNLTGIRPVKIIRTKLDEGFTPKEAAAYMQENYDVSDEKTALSLEVALREKKLLDEIQPQEGYSLYVDVPFCPSICLYCSFGSHLIGQWKSHVPAYLEALFRELDMISEVMKGKRLDSIYIGGGTPTSIDAMALDTLLSAITQRFPMDDLREFTVEAGRPDTVTEDRLRVLREYPVSRISINPQTMNQKTLDVIGRRHTVEETIDRFAMARRLGFDNINMDMIVGLPGEGAEEIGHTLEEIIKLDPDNLTVHSLALKRATRLALFKDQYKDISFDNSVEIMNSTTEAARAMHMHPYYLYRQKNIAGNFENVGYAREGKDGIYNILIMEEKQTIMAAGCGASTKFVTNGGQTINRVENVKDLRNYIERIDEMIERKRVGIDKYLS